MVVKSLTLSLEIYILCMGLSRSSLYDSAYCRPLVHRAGLSQVKGSSFPKHMRAPPSSVCVTAAYAMLAFGYGSNVLKIYSCAFFSWIFVSILFLGGLRHAPVWGWEERQTDRARNVSKAWDVSHGTLGSPAWDVSHGTLGSPVTWQSYKPIRFAARKGIPNWFYSPIPPWLISKHVQVQNFFVYSIT